MSQPPDAPPVSSTHRGEWIAVFLMMLISAILSFRVFFPHLRDIVIFDEAYYINRGQELLHGTLPVFAENPLVATFWAIVSLPFRASPFWMVHAYGLGRFIVFAMLWRGMYAVARAWKGPAHPLVPVGFLLVTPSLLGLLDNSTDGVFAALSAFALARFLVFRREARPAFGVQTSILLGLAALARNDGLVLFTIATLFTLCAPAPQCSRTRQVAAILLPALLVVGGYVVGEAISSKSFNLGIARRSYDAFEQGEGVANYLSYGARNPYVEGYDAARRLYGTPEANRNSVVRAIMRNRKAFGRRAISALVQTPAQMFAAYGRGLRGVGAVLFLLALRGGIALWRGRQRALLLILLLWCSHLGLYLLTFYREGYFLLVYAPVFALAAVGASALFGEAGRWEMPCSAGMLVLVILYGIAGHNDLLVWPGVAFLLAVLAMWILSGRLRVLPHEVRGVAGASAVLLAFSLQVQFSRPARLDLPTLPRLGTEADEMAARFLADTQQEGTPVAAYTVAPIVMAKMYYVAPHIDGRWISSPEDFLRWVSMRNVHVFFVDRNFRTCEPQLWEIMQELIGTHLSVGFHADDDYESVDVLFH